MDVWPITKKSKYKYMYTVYYLYRVTDLVHEI